MVFGTESWSAGRNRRKGANDGERKGQRGKKQVAAKKKMDRRNDEEGEQEGAKRQKGPLFIHYR